MTTSDPRQLAAFCLLLTLPLFGCGSVTTNRTASPPAGAAPVSSSPDGIPRFGALPPLDQLAALAAARGQTGTLGATSADGSKQPSWWLEDAWNGLSSWVMGAFAIASSPNATVKGSSLELSTGPGELPGFAVYAIPAGTGLDTISAGVIGSNSAGVIGSNSAGLISDGGGGFVSEHGGAFLPDGAASFANNRHYALANFSEDRWAFADVSDEGLIDFSTLPGSPSDYVSPTSQQVFIAPILYSPDEAATMQVSGFAPLGRRAGDTTLAPPINNFAATPVRGGLHFTWNDLATPGVLNVQVFMAARPFNSVDEEGVFTVGYPAANLEGLFDISLPGTLFIRARAHHIHSGSDGPLTAFLTAAPLPGDALRITLDAVPLEAEPGVPAVLTATGADNYDWDLNGDGVYDVAADTTGVQNIVADKPGPVNVRVRGHDSTNGLALRTIAINRHGWVQQQVDPASFVGGTYAELIRLTDGRLAVAYTDDNGAIRYAVSRNNFPASQADWDIITLPPSVDPGNFASDRFDLELINGTPAIGTIERINGELWYFYCATPDGAGPADWHKALADQNAGTGIGIPGQVALAEVGGRPALAYNGAALLIAGNPGDKCMSLNYQIANDAQGTSWSQASFTEVSSTNLYASNYYVATGVDLEVVAGKPVIVHDVFYGPATIPGNAGVEMLTLGASPPAWDVVRSIQNDGYVQGRTLVDCGGVPGFFWSPNFANSDLLFELGATTIPVLPEGGAVYGSFSAQFSQGELWVAASGGPQIGLMKANQADGFAQWTNENMGTGAANTDLILRPGYAPAIAWSTAGFNAVVYVAVRF
jgi:hypothetical protein